MGDRSQIAIKMATKKDPKAKVYLYGHWIGTDIYKALQEALRAVPDRHDDEEYLARKIFEKMLNGDTGETGFGIGNQAHGDIEHLIPVVDCNDQTISFEQPEWEHNQKELPQKMSFQKFMALGPNEYQNW